MVDPRTLLGKFLQHYFVLAEANIDEGFPNLQFVIHQCEIQTRRDRNKNGGGLIEYVRKGLICKSLEDTTDLNSEIILPQITIKNSKWTIFSAYRPPCNPKIGNFLGDLSSLLNKNLSKYDNVIIMSDCNIDVKDKTNPNFDKFSELCGTLA